MAKYGAFKYGDGTKYGVAAASAPTGALTWILLVDWEKSGSFSGVNEASLMVDCKVRRGRQYYVNPDGKGFDRVMVGEAQITLENKDYRYDPYNATSPIYDNVRPGRYAVLMVKDNTTGTTYTVLTGKIADIKPISGKNEQVKLTLVDGLRELYDADVTVGPFFYTGISSLIDRVLTSAGWPSRMGRNIIANTTPVTVFELDNENAGDNIHALADAGLGTFFAARDGKATFYPRTYNGMASYDLDQPELLKEIPIPQPWEVVRNLINVVCNRQMKRRMGPIWYLPDPVFIASGATETIEAQYEAALDVTPHEHSANTLINGAGTDLTASFSVTCSARRKSATLTVYNGSASDGYLTGLTLDGRTFELMEAKNVTRDTTSIADYGIRRFELNTPWLQDRNFAKAYKTILLAFLKDARKIPVVYIDQRPALQYAPDLFDKVHLTVAAKTVDDATLHIGMIEHEWLESTGQSVRTTFTLQPLLYDTTSITPAPRDPDLPEIPEVPQQPGTPYPPTPTVPTIPDCLNEFYAPWNGPFALSFDKSTVNAGESAKAPLRCTVRAGSVFYKTFMTIGWRFSGDAFNECQIGGYVGNDIVVTGTLNGTRVEFNAPSPIAVDGFMVTVNSGGTGLSYALGDLMLTGGTVAANSSTGVLAASNLTPGSYVALTAYGTFNGGSGYTGSDCLASMDNGATWPGGTIIVVNGYNFHVYQVGTAGTMYVRVADTYFPDNSGSMNFDVYHATALSNRKIILDSADIYNICAR